MSVDTRHAGLRETVARARVRPFREAGEAYVDRVGSSAGGDTRVFRANERRIEVMRQLATDDCHRLVYRFSQFFALSRGAGVDPMELCFDPPVLARDAKRAFSGAAPGWISGDTLREPARQGHEVFLADVPELACFGFIAVEVLTPVMLRWLDAPLEGRSSAQFAKALNTDLTAAIAGLRAQSSVKEHDARVFFALVRGLEDVAGGDFSFSQLDDEQVLEVWRRTAPTADGAVRFAEFMDRLSALSAEVWASEAEGAGATADPLEDSLVPDDAGPSFSAGEWFVHALTDPLVVDLLSKADHALAAQQLRTLAHLNGLYLSRARLMTFGPVENLVIEAKRQRADVRAALDDSRAETSHLATLTVMASTIGNLESFVSAGIHLLWRHGQRGEAVRVALEMGWVTADEVATMLPDAAFATHALPDVGRADFQAREPGGALREALERGQFAWQKLRRRKPFADLDARVERVPALEEGTMHASHLAGALASLHGRIDEAVGVRRDADGFAAEFETFANALADIHGFERGGHRP